jgi:hypothetical protein
MGETLVEVNKDTDRSPYFQLESVDPKWWEAISGEQGVGDGGEETNAVAAAQ